MAQFYASIQGNRGEATRMGTKASGIEGHIRGWNIDNTILIFEEGQNSTPNQMKLLLTRIGFNSKFFISGDLEQTDRYKDKTQSGLWDAINKFKDMEEIGVFEFGEKDIVRNPLISKILKRYEE